MYVQDEEQEDNRNVYALIDEYYKEHKAAEGIIPKRTVDNFMRKMLWAGESQEELKEMWPVIKLVLFYIEDDALDYIERLTGYDYLYILWRASNGKLGNDIYLLTEENVNYFADVLRKFYEFLTDGAQPNDHKLPFMVEMFRKYVYVMGKFDFPELEPFDDYFGLLLKIEEMDPEETEDINNHVDELINKAGDYFQTEKFQVDVGRAMSLYADGIVPVEDRDDQEFYLGFWDYFMFDYHLFSSDLTPIQYYYKKERHRLSPTDRLMLREILSAKFNIFEVSEVYEDGAMLCKNLFNDDVFILPPQSLNCKDVSQVLLCAHTYNSGFILLNYLNQYIVSPKLRERIKSEIEYHLEMFRCQKPKATMDDFLVRHSIVARHIIDIYTMRAQLGIVPVRQLPPPMKKRQRSFISREEKNDYLDFIHQILVSRFSCHIVWDLFCDAAAAGTLSVWGEGTLQAKCAVLLVFMRINMYPEEMEKEVCNAFGVNVVDAKQLADWIAGDLQLTEADPRYLSEEGYKASILFQM